GQRRHPGIRTPPAWSEWPRGRLPHQPDWLTPEPFHYHQLRIRYLPEWPAVKPPPEEVFEKRLTASPAPPLRADLPWLVLGWLVVVQLLSKLRCNSLIPPVGQTFLSALAAGQTGMSAPPSRSAVRPNDDARRQIETVPATH